MGTKSMGSLVAITVLLVGMGMVSAGVVRQEIEFDERPVVLLLPENFDKGNGLLLLVLHLHAARGSEKAPDLDLDASGYRDLPGKYRVMVAAPRAAFHQTFRIFAWNSFFSLAGCDSLNADDVGFLNGLLDELLDTYPIDPQRVYIYGYSSGANMALVWCTVKLDTDLGIVTQRRCPDESTRTIHRAPRARSSQSDWRGEEEWVAETPAVFCTAEDRSRPPTVAWGTA